MMYLKLIAKLVPAPYYLKLKIKGRTALIIYLNERFQGYFKLWMYNLKKSILQLSYQFQRSRDIGLMSGR